MCGQKPEIIMLYQQGLGNQMFQYALKLSFKIKGFYTNDYIGLYQQFPEKMCNKTFELNNAFKNLKLNIIQQDIGVWHYNERQDQPGRFIPTIWNIKKEDPVSFDGFWQTEKYFKDIRKDLLKHFKFNKPEHILKYYGRKFSSSKTPTVAIHIRRGDYLELDTFNNICTKTYYDNAINYMRKQLGENIQFIVFSNDIEWCKNNYPDFTYIDINKFKKYQDWYDMYLMSKCQHNIIANSSFSWWGAWLNKNPNQIVVAPNQWLNGYSTDDIWCDKWIKLETK